MCGENINATNRRVAAACFVLFAYSFCPCVYSITLFIGENDNGNGQHDALHIHNFHVRRFRFRFFAHFAFATCRYIIGAETAHALGDWRYALRVTPALGVIAVLLIFLTREPERGQHEGSHHLQTTSYKDDLIGAYHEALMQRIIESSIFEWHFFHRYFQK